jgi:hypothetical protein
MQVGMVKETQGSFFTYIDTSTTMLHFDTIALKTRLSKITLNLDTITHVCNPSYLGDWDQEDQVQG